MEKLLFSVDKIVGKVYFLPVTWTLFQFCTVADTSTHTVTHTVLRTVKNSERFPIPLLCGFTLSCFCCSESQLSTNTVPRCVLLVLTFLLPLSQLLNFLLLSNFSLYEREVLLKAGWTLRFFTRLLGFFFFFRVYIMSRKFFFSGHCLEIFDLVLQNFVLQSHTAVV